MITPENSNQGNDALCKVIDAIAYQEDKMHRRHVFEYGVVAVSAAVEPLYPPLRLVQPGERLMTHGWNENTSF